MTPAQAARWRTLAEAELQRGNALAAVVLDLLDDVEGAPVAVNRFVTTADPETVPPYVASADGVDYDTLRAEVAAEEAASAAAVASHDDGDDGIETYLGDSPSGFGGRAGFR